VLVHGMVCLTAGALLLAVVPARAADFDGLFAGSDDYGGVGLLQTPTARMRDDGEFGLGISTVRPYNQVHFFLQPLPWLETVVRYTAVTNRLYGGPSSTSGQSYKDKSADVKVRLLNETKYWPSLALGVQDIGGTGLFSSEYLVGSYHYYDFDFSAALAWGRLGSSGDIPNPFGAFGHHFNRDRYAKQDLGQGGTPGLSSWFTGKNIGPFGGVAWNTPVKGLSLRVEYDGNGYKHEGLGDTQRQDSPVNFGIAYRGLRGLDLGVGYERGNRVMARIAIYTNLQSLRGVAKTADPQPLAVPPRPQPPAPADTAASPAQAPEAAPPDSTAVPRQYGASIPVLGGATTPSGSASASLPVSETENRSLEQAFITDLRQSLRQQGFSLIALDYDRPSKEVRVWLNQDRFRNPAKAVGRAARVLSATAPAEILKFTIINVDLGVETYRATLRRADFESAARAAADPDVALASIQLTGPGDGFGNAEYFDATRMPKFSWDMGPAVRQSVGGPDGFYFGQLYWKVGGAVALTDHLNITSAAGFNIINNFNDIKLQSNSALPHVRSDIVKYLQRGKDSLINLEADYIWSPLPSLYHRMSAGIFEEMYGGVATELLYRPYGRSWAAAIDLNRVKKRAFDGGFGFQDYQVTTGHVTLYYEPGFYNLLFKLSAGQYLAHDRGGTIDISREFNSGVRAGVFATKTNVSAAQFGEGSFDKGLYLVLPLDLFFARSTRREAAFSFRPLTRDGGQMVYDGPELYFAVQGSQPADFARGASELLK
jgi:hypothetical protein